MAQQLHTLQNPHLQGEAFYWEGGRVGVLLIHGFTATTAEVRPLAGYLREHGYAVAGPLLPGHNSQPADLNRVVWQDWMGVCESMYGKLAEHCERVFVGGESTGGLLALMLAANHPEIAGVLAYAPALRLNMNNTTKLRLHLLSPFVPFAPKANLSPDMPWQGYKVNPLRGTLQLLKLQGQVMRKLGQVRQPLLVVMGRHDPTVHPITAELITSAVASQVKETVWMEQSRHCVILDKEWEQAAEISLRFIEQHTERA